MAEMARLSVVPIVVYGLAEGLVRGLNLVFLPLLTRLFSAQEFGEIALITSMIGLVGLFANCGLGNAVHRFYFEPSANAHSRAMTVSAGFWTLSALSAGGILFVALVVSVLSGLNMLSLPAPAITIAVALLAVIPIQLLQFGQDVMRLYAAHWRYFFIAVMKTVVAFALGLPLVYWFDAGVLGYFTGFLAGHLILMPWVASGLRSAIILKPDLAESRRLIGYGYPFILAGLAQWLISSIDLWVLGALQSSADVGIYSVSLKIAAIVSFITAAFGLAWSPEVLRLHAEDPHYKKVVGRILIHLTVFLFSVAALVGLLAPYLFNWLIPADYGTPTLIVAILSFSMAVAGTTQVTILGMVFEKRSDLIAKLNWLVAIASLLSSIVFVLLFGLLGAAFSNLMISLLLTGAYFWLTQKIHPLTIDRKDGAWVFMRCLAIVACFAGLMVFGMSLAGLLAKIAGWSLLFGWLWHSGRWGKWLMPRGKENI